MKHKILKSGIIMLSIFISLLFASCKGGETKSQLYAMNTVVELTFYGGDETALVSKELNRLESLFSVTREESDILKINSSEGKAVTVSEDTALALETARQVYTDTHGCFDPTVYPVVRLWGFTTDNYRVPDSTEIENALKYTDFSRVSIDGLQVCAPKGAQLDLGGIGKGYAGKRCRDLLKEKGVSSALLSIGGNVQTVGLKPNGTKWTVALKNPDGGKSLCKVRVGECAVVTSGGYERYFEENGEQYHHIIDPKTGRPADSEFKSVTVICADGALADALSTAFFVGGQEIVREYLSKHSGVDVILYTNNNELIASEGISNDMSDCVIQSKLTNS